MSEPVDPAAVARLTTEIVTSYLEQHDVAAGDLPGVIVAIGRELATVGREPEAPPRPEPAVPVGRSVRPDHLVCLACGRKLKTLRRHLTTAHGLTPPAYRALFGLRPDYPMVAPALSDERAAIARDIGLGQRRLPEPTPEPKPGRRRAQQAAGTGAEPAPPAARPRGRRTSAPRPRRR